MLLFAITATFLYFQQAGIVSHSFPDRGAQTAFFATVDLVVNCLRFFAEVAAKKWPLRGSLKLGVGCL